MNNVSQLSANGERKERRRLQLREVGQDQAQQESTAAVDASVETSGETMTVGAALRTARLERGEEAATVASALKMRLDQLEAIESSHFAKLPGRTYALGFVRAYAQHLGLDVEEVIQRYKDESKTDPEAPKAVQHHFPEAMEEQRLPNGSILVVALVIAMVIYGISYLTIPSRKTPATAKAEEQQSVVVVQPKVSATAIVPSSVSPESVQAPAEPPPVVVPPSPVTTVATVPATPEQAAPVAAPIAAPVADTVQPQPPALGTSVAFVTGNARMPMPPLPATSIQVPEDPQALTQLASAIVVVPGAKNLNQPAASVPVQTVSGNSNAVGRVTFTAVQATYIRIRDLRQTGANTVIDRVLNPGESFQPPDRAGLVMQTGNAGGLQVQVDGKTIGVLGKSGEVITRIPVDASYFLERLAQQQ